MFSPQPSALAYFSVLLIFIAHKDRPIPVKKREAAWHIPSTSRTMTLFIISCRPHVRTLELGFTSHSLTFNLSFLLFFLHIAPRLGLLSFFSFLFLYFIGSLQSLAWLWAHLVAFNFHVNCFFNDFSIPSLSLIPFIM